MFLYNLTLQRATGISYAIHGNFSGSWKIKKRGKKGAAGRGVVELSGSVWLGAVRVVSSGVCGGMEGGLGV